MWDNTAFDDVSCKTYYGDPTSYDDVSCEEIYEELPTDDGLEIPLIVFINDKFQEAIEAMGMKRAAAGWTDLEPSMAN